MSLTTLVALVSLPSEAQSPVGVGLGNGAEVGGETEAYLRVLELAGMAPAHHWSLRPLAAGRNGFSADSVHPWRTRWKVDTSRRNVPRFLRPSARLIANSAFPVQWGSGPTWAGRGFTLESQGGVAWNLGALNIQVAPIGFIAQNSNFALAGNGAAGAATYRDARVPGNIDAPQRFGSTAYGRIDAGASTIELRLPVFLVGISTAPRSWGPAIDYPLVLSDHAGGFVHAYVATRAPVNIGPLNVHGMVLAGSLKQSSWSPTTSGIKGRTSAGAILTVGTRYVPGLEVGFARFTHHPSDSLLPSFEFVSRLFATGLSRTGSVNLAAEDQLGSFFARWAFPGAGIEAYGEYYREDYSLDMRRFLQYPDDYGAYTLGIQRVRVLSPTSVRAIRLEVVNGEPSTSNRGERGDRVGSMLVKNPIYQHSGVTQGHTNRGLILGSPEAFGGAAVRVTIDRYTTKGRSSWVFERALRLEGTHPDVIFSLRRELMRFVGTREMTFSIAPALNLNRNLQTGHDVFNLNASFAVRGLR